MLSLRFGEEIQKIQNQVEQKVVLDEEEYQILIKEFQNQVRVLRGALRRYGISYPLAKPDSLLHQFLKDDEYDDIEEYLNEEGKNFKRKNYESNSDENNSYNESDNNNSDSNSNNNSPNPNNKNIASKRKKSKNSKNSYENKNKNLNQKSIQREFSLSDVNNNILDSQRESMLSFGRQFSFNRDENNLNNTNSNMDLLNTEKYIEEIKAEAVKKINFLIYEKSEEIKNLNLKNEEILNEMNQKEKDCAEKKNELRKEISELKFKLKKSEAENNSLNEFILTYQSDVISLQGKLEKKSKKIFDGKKIFLNFCLIFLYFSLLFIN